MYIEEGVLCSVEGDKGKVKLGNRFRDVKLDTPSNFKEGDKVKVILGLVVGKA
ncbi:MAG: hypothetical protein J7L08_02815 [Candidatus Aenigmarchaeota archaeon]|nr:hypothetical protein [Candidatus Aenigmarchaeota archaeon]